MNSLYYYYWRFVVPLVTRMTARGPSGQAKSVWIDVGAHMGESTLREAVRRRECIVYAFEPNIKAVSGAFALLDNYIVVPMAVTESDGFTEIHLNSEDVASSTLPLDEEGLKKWKSRRPLRNVATAIVPAIRLDSFMRQMHISCVDYLKIDAQGGDLAVLRSAGDRIRDIKEVCMEVQITDVPIYVGAPTKDEVLEFMTGKGFTLVQTTRQSFDQEENLLFRRFDWIQAHTEVT